MQPASSSDLISALGGKRALCEKTGAQRRAVDHWVHNGIPAKYWPDVVELAAEKGLPGISFDTLRALQAERTPATAEAA